MCEDKLPPLPQRKVSEIREMIMEGEGKGNLMGGNRLDFSVILMSSCLFQIILEGTDTLVYHKTGLYCKPVQRASFVVVHNKICS